MLWVILAIITFVIIGTVTNTLNTVIVILFFMAFILLGWGLAQLALPSESAETRKKAKQTVLWGIIALFVMASTWGIVTVVVDYFLGSGSGPVRGILPKKPGDIP